MKRSTIMVFCILLSVASFVGTFSGYVSGTRVIGVKKQQNPSQAEAAEELLTDSYIISENGGKLALYRQTQSGKKRLWEQYDSETSLLPEADREELKNGIEAHSIDEAMQIIEDFTS